MLDRLTTAVATGAISVVAAIMGTSNIVVWMLVLLTWVLILPTVLAFIVSLYQQWFIEDPPVEEFESVDEAELWLLERGYKIVHECDLGHIVGVKKTRLPGFTVSQEIVIGEDEARQIEGDPRRQVQ